MTAMTASKSSPAAQDPRPAKPQWEKMVGLLVRWRVRITAIVFTLLILEDVLEGVKPHDVINFHDVKTVVGCALIMAGLMLRSWSAGILQKDARLTTAGPYGVIRNPLYVGSFLLMIGFCTLIDDAENIWFVLGPFVVLYVLKVLREERGLAKRFGEPWRNYVRSVPRFLPRRLPNSGLVQWNLRQWLGNREYRAVSAVLLGLVALESWRLL